MPLLLFFLAALASNIANAAPKFFPTPSDTILPAKTTVSTPAAINNTQTPNLNPTNASFQLGISRLRANRFDIIKGKRVGLLTHAAAVDETGTTTIEVLRKAEGVNLAALYAPEHGLDGQTRAEEKIDDEMYEGIPVFSLYGNTRKPTREMLKGIDVMLVDLQDVGVRSYTYVSAMKLTIQACFEQKIPVIVLDRPNPLGGLKVDGPVLDPRWRSYVGAYEVPYVHGLTIGELSLVAQEELKPLTGSLTIIKMNGWRRNMLWNTLPVTLKWRATSPAVPTLGAAFGYACSGLGSQLGGFRHGYGTEYPFRFLSHPKMSPEELKTRLDRERIPGFSFDVMTIPQGRRAAGEKGVYVRITDWESAEAIRLSLTLLQISQELSGSEPFAEAKESSQELFCKHWGRNEPLKTLISDKKLNAATLGRYWHTEALRWQADAKKYWLY